MSCTAAEAAAAAATAQLSSGRRGHFSLLAIRCNADSSQGYACVTASTGRIKDAGASGLRNDEDSRELWPSRPIMVLFIAAEPHFQTYKSQIESVSCYRGLTASILPFPTLHLTVFHHYGADIR